uniref:Lithostathine-1-beta-like isoform X2 n=1 Tax=Phascolarctos cinereus TaxID=38626 RepID=A0A6P5LFD7_PHACI|nr:lithostathine-1-beta-like isoform X2 [Phascolarctos cinereus]
MGPDFQMDHSPADLLPRKIQDLWLLLLWNIPTTKDLELCRGAWVWLQQTLYQLNCQSLPSGHLLSLMNESEAAFVAALATQSLGENRSHLWIGLHDPSQNICWRWSDNATLTLVTWEKGAPTKTTLKFCVSLSPRSGFLQWKNQHCNEELPFICKFSA